MTPKRMSWSLRVRATASKLRGGDFQQVARGAFGEEQRGVVVGVFGTGDAGEIDAGAQAAGEEHFGGGDSQAAFAEIVGGGDQAAAIRAATARAVAGPSSRSTVGTLAPIRPRQGVVMRAAQFALGQADQHQQVARLFGVHRDALGRHRRRCSWR